LVRRGWKKRITGCRYRENEGRGVRKGGGGSENGEEGGGKRGEEGVGRRWWEDGCEEGEKRRRGRVV